MKETIKQKLIEQNRMRKDERNKQAIFYNEYHSDCTPDNMTVNERNQYFIEVFGV